MSPLTATPFADFTAAAHAAPTYQPYTNPNTLDSQHVTYWYQLKGDVDVHDIDENGNQIAPKQNLVT